jgi:CPA2 family monovalent cation:H+ antiporter-2
MVVGRWDYSLRAASEALPMRDAFAVLFFVSIGMLLDPRYLVRAPALIAASLAVVMVGKPLVAILIVRLLKYPFRAALVVGAALAQIGEFSFMVVALGRQLGMVTDAAMNTVVVVAIVSIVINPMLYRATGRLERWSIARPRLWSVLDPPIGAGAAGRIDGDVTGSPADRPHRAVIVGYGPSGRTLTRLLKDNGVEPTVIELNIDTVRHLRDAGVPAVYGDASDLETLQSAGASNAGSLILTAAEMPRGAEVIRLARDLNPAIRVLARTSHLRGGAALRQAGADEVFSGEGEVALALTEAVLRQLGATPEQIERERARAHEELFDLE